MRKYVAYGAAALLVLSGGASALYAQDATATVTPPTQQQVVAQTTWLGVSVSDDGAGVTIQWVLPGSPAETAKLAVGDVITSVNGTAVDTAADLRAIIDAAVSGDVVTLALTRGTDTLSVDVTLAAHMGIGRGDRGLAALPTDSLQAAELVLHAQLEAVDGGYKVDSVMDRNGFTLAVGDVITEVNGTAITSADWKTLLTPTANAAPTLTLTVTRDGASTTLEGQLRMFGGRGGGPFGGPGNGPRGNNGQPGGGPPNGDNNGQPGGALPNGNNGQPVPPTGVGGGSI